MTFSQIEGVSVVGQKIIIFSYLTESGIINICLNLNIKLGSNQFSTILTALWDPASGSGGVPQLKGAKSFTFEELKKYTRNFSETNNIGAGGYGMVSCVLFIVSTKFQMFNSV